MTDLEKIKQLVATDLHRTDAVILEKLASQIPLAEEIAAHIIHSGGKRIRPMLVLLSAQALNYQGMDHLRLAATVELLHTATLLHDDVIDESKLRRGKQTANAKWGNEASVLVGDFLYARTFQLIAEINDGGIFKLISDAGSYIVEGEVLQLMHCHDELTSQETYLEIIRRKTGRLFSVAASSVAVLMKAPGMTIDALANYGEALGMAFQMLDDALDYDADPEITGKNLGDDLTEGKPTLPLIYTLEHGKEEAKTLIKHALKHPEEADIAEISQAIQFTGAIDYTKKQAQKYVQEAIEHLNALPDSFAREALAMLAKLAGDRDQ